MHAMRVGEYSMWLRKRAWAIALVGTVIGTGMILPLARDGFGLWLLWIMPITWLVIYVTVRIAAKFLPDMFFPAEK
jgi:amino acid permease